MASSFSTSTPDYDKNVIFTVTHKLLQQLVDLLESFPDDKVYAKASVVMPGGTIGKHTRHIYDHFYRLLYDNPLWNAQKHWVVDYDVRSRNQPMETVHQEAIQSLREMQRHLQDTEESLPLGTPIVLAATIDPAETVPKYFIDSSFERELWYCCMHAIHHYASIKAICIENQIPVTEDFGVAPSTTLYYQHQKLNNGHHHL